MKQYTVFFDQINRTNFQVLAETEEQAELIATKLYKKHQEFPTTYVQQGWIKPSDGEDK